MFAQSPLLSSPAQNKTPSSGDTPCLLGLKLHILPQQDLFLQVNSDVPTLSLSRSLCRKYPSCSSTRPTPVGAPFLLLFPLETCQTSAPAGTHRAHLGSSHTLSTSSPLLCLSWAHSVTPLLQGMRPPSSATS